MQRAIDVQFLNVSMLITLCTGLQCSCPIVTAYMCVMRSCVKRYAVPLRVCCHAYMCITALSQRSAHMFTVMCCAHTHIHVSVQSVQCLHICCGVQYLHVQQ
jgi:hypothetical protein